MHRYSAHHTLRQREPEENSEQNFSKLSQNNPAHSVQNFTDDTMAPRETIPSTSPECRLPNLAPTQVPIIRGAVAVEPHHQLTAHHHHGLRMGTMPMNPSVEATSTGIGAQEERQHLPGPGYRCEMNIVSLQNELMAARHQIGVMSLQMEEQSSHLHHLLEERFDLQAAYRPEMSFPLFTTGGCNPAYTTYPQNLSSADIYPGFGHNPRCTGVNTNQYYNTTQRSQPLTNTEKNQLVRGLNPQFVSQLSSHNSDLVGTLNDKVMALHMANLKLNLYLKKEESRRKNAETELVKERDYIRKLEDNIQNLKSTRIVMDPKTYKQVADKYIASKKRPVRRSHTCHPYIGQGDLVCDNKGGLQSQILAPSVTSCPSSPLNGKSTSSEEKNSSDNESKFWSEEEQVPMQREYENLLNSLADMEMPSSSTPLESAP